MSTPQDQPARDPGRGGTAGNTTAAGTPQPSDATGRQYVPRQAQGYDDTGQAERRPSRAVVGFTLMAAVLMMLSGIWGFFEGLAAIIRGGFFVVRSNYAYSISATGWGWIHLILGILVFAAGVALLADALWARIVGVVIASFSAIANFLFIPYYPVWSIVVIAIDLIIIWALLSPRNEWALRAEPDLSAARARPRVTQQLNKEPRWRSHSRARSTSTSATRSRTGLRSSRRSRATARRAWCTSCWTTWGSRR